MPQMVRICGSGADYTTGARAESRASSQEVIVEVIRFIPQERTFAHVTSASAAGTNCGSSVHSTGGSSLHRGGNRGVPVPQIMAKKWR